MSLLDYVTGTPWALHGPVLDGFVAVMQRHFDGVKLSENEIRAAIGEKDKSENEKLQVTFDGTTAYIGIRGVLARFSDQVNGSSQPRGRSYESIIRDLDEAVVMGANRIILHMTSPGGAVHGVQEVADRIAEIVSSGIEVVAYADGLMASGAYYIAAPCSAILAAPNAIVGSIGVITSIVDVSELYNKAGAKLHVIRSGPFKAVGQSGEPIHDNMLEPEHALISDMFDAFRTQVAAGRGLDGVRLDAVTDGRVFSAERAMGLGLVDGILSYRKLKQTVQENKPLLPIATVATGESMVGKPAATKNEGNNMKIPVLAALTEEYPDHAARITRLAAEGSTEDEIRAAIAEHIRETEQAAIVAERDALRADCERLTLALEESVEMAKDYSAKLAAAEQQIEELKAIGSAPPDPGATNTGPEVEPDYSAMSIEERRQHFMAKYAN